MEENRVGIVTHYCGTGKTMFGLKMSMEMEYAKRDAELTERLTKQLEETFPAIAQGMSPQIIVIDSMATAEKQRLDELKEYDLIQSAPERKKNHEPFWKGIKSNGKRRR
ncbi:hypothetical protein [Bacillus phage YungSlug]|nr:hypothetical protein [Bacillus phage YungSlug]